MFLLRLIHFLRGYVRLRAQGGFPERFLNLCSNLGIPLWEVESRDGILFANTTPSGYRLIRSPAKKSGMRVRIEKKHGASFFAFHHRRRAGLLLGLACFFLIIGVLSGMIWTVSVQGCERLHQDEISAVLYSLGVRPGVRRSSIDIESVESSALSLLPQVSWLSINFQGSAVIVEVRETISSTPQKQDDSPANLVSAADGQIVTMEVFSGSAEQKPSAAVLKGDLLVGGITQNRDGSVTFRRASGYITAVTNHSVKTELSQPEEIESIADIRTRCTLVFFGIKIPFGPFRPGNLAVYREESYITLGSVRMPVGIILERAYYVKSGGAQPDVRATRLFALEKHFSQCAAEFKYMQVMNRQTTLREKNGTITITGSYQCLQNIGQSRPIEIDSQPAP